MPRSTKKKTSPKRVKKTSPRRVKKTSPRRVKKTSPKRVKKTSPKRKVTSPKRKVTSPKRKVTSPKRVKGTSKGRMDSPTGIGILDWMYWNVVGEPCNDENPYPPTRCREEVDRAFDDFVKSDGGVVSS